MAVPRFRRRESINPLPGVRVSAGSAEAAYGAPISEAASRLAVRAQQMADDFDDAATLEAHRKFSEEVLQYHNDPNKGVLNKLGKDASGLYSEADKWMKAKADEYTKNMKNPRMIQNFQRRAEGTILSQSESNSRYETAQLRAYRIGEADMAIETAINNAAANWDNEAAVAAARQSATEALELKNRGMGDEVHRATLAELDNKIEMNRILVAESKNPLLAAQMIEESKGLFPSVKAQLQKRVEGEVQRVETQQFVDALVAKFPPNKEEEGLKYIRANYSGEEEERHASAYKTRVGELEIRRAKAEAQRNKWQANNYHQLYKDYYANGIAPPRAVLDKMLSEGRISTAQHRQAVGEVQRVEIQWQANNYEQLYKDYYANGIAPPRAVLDKMLSEGRISTAQHRQAVGEVQRVETQQFVDTLVAKFPPDKEEEGLKYIRDNYSGEEEERHASAYKMRVGELEIGENKAEAQRNKWQANNYHQLYKDYYANGIAPPRESLDKMLDEGYISTAQHRQAVGWNSVLATRAGTIKTLKKSIGEDVWNGLSIQEQDKAIMREQGVTSEARQELLPALTMEAVNGSLTDEYLNRLYNGGYITGSEKTYYKGLNTKFTKEQTEYQRRQKKQLQNDISTLFGLDYKGEADIKKVAEALFDEKIADLDTEAGKDAKNYRALVLQARQDALVEAVEKARTDLGIGLYKNGNQRNPTLWGKRVGAVRSAIGDAIQNVKEYEPKVYDSLTQSSSSAPVQPDESTEKTPHEEDKKPRNDTSKGKALWLLKPDEPEIPLGGAL